MAVLPQKAAGYPDAPWPSLNNNLIEKFTSSNKFNSIQFFGFGLGGGGGS
jgi:hypothetical protein